MNYPLTMYKEEERQGKRLCQGSEREYDILLSALQMQWLPKNHVLKCLVGPQAEVVWLLFTCLQWEKERFSLRTWRWSFMDMIYLADCFFHTNDINLSIRGSSCHYGCCSSGRGECGQTAMPTFQFWRKCFCHLKSKGQPYQSLWRKTIYCVVISLQNDPPWVPHPSVMPLGSPLLQVEVLVTNRNDGVSAWD